MLAADTHKQLAMTLAAVPVLQSSFGLASLVLFSYVGMMTLTPVTEGSPVVDIFVPLSCGNTSLMTRTVEAGKSLFYGNTMPNNVQVNSHDSCLESEELESLVQIINDVTSASHMIIGPANHGLCNNMAKFASFHDKAVVSWRCSGMEMQNADMFPTFLRTLPSNAVTAQALGAVLRHFLWKRVAIVTSSGSPCWGIVRDIYLTLSDMDYIIDHVIQVPSDRNNSDPFLSSLKTISIETKAILLCGDDVSLPYMLQSVSEAGLSGGDHALIVIDTYNSIRFDPDGAVSPAWLDNSNYPLGESTLRSIVILSAHAHPLSLYESMGYIPSIAQNQFTTYDEFLYAAISLSAQVVETLHSKSLSALGRLVKDDARSLTFPGLYANLTTDQDGVVPSHFSGWDYQASTGTFLPVFELSDDLSEVATLKSLDWPNGQGPGTNYCLFFSCEDEGLGAVSVVMIILGSLALVVGAVVAGWFIRRRIILKEMEKGPNKIIMVAGDLDFISSKALNKSVRSVNSTQHTHTNPHERPDLLKNSEPSLSVGSFMEVVSSGDTARYNGDIVFVKQLRITGFELKSKARNYIKGLREFRHENLNPFLGFYVDPECPALVFDFCVRRSLEDIIANDDIKLDWDFKLSLITDLVKGMKYLHSSPIKAHGTLKSGNCVVDSRWVLKITDYGVMTLYDKYGMRLRKSAKDLLWTAPELLRDPELQHKNIPPKADVYSFSIILQELIVRGHPFCMLDLEPEAIIKKLRKPPPLCRPSVSQGAAPPQYIQIMKQCWAEMPDLRPEFEEINKQIKDINKGKKMNIVDTMFKMLEKYSNDLEDIVRVRTLALEEEKKKTEKLLSEMLPPSVAKALMTGERVEAESFDDVTIYFSDIVGFTTISAMSTPLQVVDLLNDLYTIFDSTIDEHDVYKVETIGDAYMVVSGLPVRNGNRHAGEISMLALDLLYQCGQFKIRHMPEIPLRLRIGLHSGHCVAGVVGLRMPRYCLFGDTVNTASRMESTGAAFRIHVSPFTKSILDDLGGYHLDYRGETELKGKGMVKSYWLTGKDGFTKPLPEPPPLTSGNAHGLASLGIEATPQLKSESSPAKELETTTKCDKPEESNLFRQNVTPATPGKKTNVHTEQPFRKTSNQESQKKSNHEERKNSFRESVFKYSSFSSSTEESERKKNSVPQLRQYSSQKNSSKLTVPTTKNPPSGKYGTKTNSSETTTTSTTDWLNANNNHDDHNRKISSKDVIVNVDNEGTKVQNNSTVNSSGKTNGIVEGRRKSEHSVNNTVVLDERNVVQTSHA